jgi:hypothetical protein
MVNSSILKFARAQKISLATANLHLMQLMRLGAATLVACMDTASS